MTRLSNLISPLKAMEYVLSRSMEYYLDIMYFDTIVSVGSSHRNERFRTHEDFKQPDPTEVDKLYATLRAVRRTGNWKKSMMALDATKPTPSSAD